MVQLRLISKNEITYLSDAIASFTLEKEMYTPYSSLTACVYGNFDMEQFAQIYRVQLNVNDTVLHLGSVEQFRLCKEKGVNCVRLSSRGLTAMLLQNRLEPGLHTGISLNGLMTDFVTLPEEITWESDTDTSNYLYVKDNTSMWDGVANLTYKLCERYPFIYQANEVRMHLPDSYRTFHIGEDKSGILAMGMATNQSRIYSKYSMADTDDTYGKFVETDEKAEALGIVRTKYLALDRQYLYDPQQAVIFRRKFAERGLLSYYFEWNGAILADLGDRLTYGTLLSAAPITHIRMVGSQKGIRTRLETYFDGFYGVE